MREHLREWAELFENRLPTSSDEVALQDLIESVIDATGVPYEREVRLSAADRIDFLVAPGVGMEVKVAGSLPALLRQLQRYAQHDRVGGLLVVTNRSRLLDLPATLSGKPVAVASLLAGGL